MEIAASMQAAGGRPLSLAQLLYPEVLADPYPLYRHLQTESPVHWDKILNTWVVTRYADVITVLQNCSAERVASVERLESLHLEGLIPLFNMMRKQMLFLDPPRHTRLRAAATCAFTPQRLEALRVRIREVACGLLQKCAAALPFDIVREFAEPLPYIITAEILDVPAADAPQLKVWSADFAEVLGNFVPTPDRFPQLRRSLEDMTRYFESAVREKRARPRESLIACLLAAVDEHEQFTETDVVANAIITMIGAQETTTNLIANGVLTLLRNPSAEQELRAEPHLLPHVIEEMLRFEPPSQHTARIAKEDLMLGECLIRKGDPAIAVLAAANRDPEYFDDPDRFDIRRNKNRHLSFGWGTHFCFGAPLARLEAEIAFREMFRKISTWSLEAHTLQWRANMGLRGLTSLPVRVTLA